MAWAYRASSYGNDGAGVQVASGGTTTATLGAALTTGDLIVLSIMGFNTDNSGNAPTFAVSDSVNGSWGSAELVTGTFILTPNAARYSVWAFPNTASGTPTITVTVTFVGGGVANLGCQCAAFSGIATSSAFDTGHGASGTGGSPSSGNVSPATAAANELMVGCYVDAGEGTTLSAGNINAVGATLAGKHDVDGGRWQGLFEYGDSGSSGGTPSATATSTGSPTGTGMIGAVFKLSGVAGIPPGLGPSMQMQPDQTLPIGW